jgi:hypothetical protein
MIGASTLFFVVVFLSLHTRVVVVREPKQLNVQTRGPFRAMVPKFEKVPHGEKRRKAGQLRPYKEANQTKLPPARQC